jgi:hypothetical protein
MNDPFQPTLATHRSAALELRLSRGDWKSVCLVLWDLFSWQDWALADIEARHDLHPNTQAAIHHAFRMNRRALTSIRYAIENALVRKGLSTITPSIDPATSILVRHSGFAELPDPIDDYGISLLDHPDPTERAMAKGYLLLEEGVVPQDAAQEPFLSK